MYHHLDTTKKSMVGRTIESITRLNDSSVMIEFRDGNKVKISVEGDCCSKSVFYEIEMPNELNGATLEDIFETRRSYDDEIHQTNDTEEVAIEKCKANGIELDLNSQKVWNVVLKTNRGNAIVRHINTSNGYYDGSTRYEWILRPD